MYKKDDIIKVRIKSIVPYGAFCEVIEPVYEKPFSGLIHISEVSDFFVSNISDYFAEGDEFGCQVIEVIPEKRQLKLSFKSIREELQNKNK